MTGRAVFCGSGKRSILMALAASPIHRALGALMVVVALNGVFGAPATAQQDGGPTPVTVVTLQARDVTLTATLPGRVVASAVAEVRPQVDGIVTERLFSEGAAVALGDPLYRIDDVAYAAKVAEAEAQVAQAEARLRAARKDAERVRSLVERGVVSDQNLDDAVAEQDAAAAGLQVAVAQLQSANIRLDRTTIRAPISGVVGRSLTTQGSLATAGQAQPLAVIRKLDPVLVDVTQSAAELLAWRRGKTATQLAEADTTVSLRLADGLVYEHTGELTAAEPNVDEQTGVVTLRMEFPNPAELLLPGMYVQVEMPQGVARDVVLAPQEGVSRNRRGQPVALVVNPDGVVERRSLTILGSRKSDWIVTGGLRDGERIIVAGIQKVQPGDAASPEERAPETTDAATGETQ